MTAAGNELQCIATLDPGAIVNIPVNAVYTPTSELFFSITDYSVTANPFVWKDLQANVTVTKTLLCKSKDVEKTKDVFYLRVIQIYLICYQIVRYFLRSSVKRSKSTTSIPLGIQWPALVTTSVFVQP